MTIRWKLATLTMLQASIFSSINPKQLTDIRQSEINREDNNINHNHLNNVKLDAVNARPRKSRHKRHTRIHELHRFYDYKTQHSLQPRQPGREQNKHRAIKNYRGSGDYHEIRQQEIAGETAEVKRH